tara:strand:- start:22 stop:456 length:435 start_codon:yes stop_codon:yes gene_type:complete
MKTIIVSGYFNPLHKGHIEYFNNAKARGDKLCVIVNSDLQRDLKGSKEFMDEQERLTIVKALEVVDVALISIDKDTTVRDTLRHIHSLNQKYAVTKMFTLAFANGGDQTNETIPERETCEELGIELIDNLGEKVQSSSWLLEGQ